MYLLIVPETEHFWVSFSFSPKMTMLLCYFLWFSDLKQKVKYFVIGLKVSCIVNISGLQKLNYNYRLIYLFIYLFIYSFPRENIISSFFSVQRNSKKNELIPFNFKLFYFGYLYKRQNV